MKQPPSVPISESENPDAIALRSAISLLQIQREKSKRDLKALEQLKHAAVQDPEGFMRSLQEQRAQRAGAHHDVLTPTLAGLTDAVESDGDGQQSVPGRKDSAGVDSNKFPAIPQPQNVVRCPPITTLPNWPGSAVPGHQLGPLLMAVSVMPVCRSAARPMVGISMAPTTASGVGW